MVGGFGGGAFGVDAMGVGVMVEVRGNRGRMNSVIVVAVRGFCPSAADAPEDGGRTVQSVKQVAAYLGNSCAKDSQLLRLPYLRRFEGCIAASSFHQLPRLHPEVVPHATLPAEHQVWLVIDGYPDPNAGAKKPRTLGLLSSGTIARSGDTVGRSQLENAIVATLPPKNSRDWHQELIREGSVLNRGDVSHPPMTPLRGHSNPLLLKGARAEQSHSDVAVKSSLRATPNRAYTYSLH